MSTAAPQVPPRPEHTKSSIASLGSELPKIPPRPINRRLDRSMSPDRYARSPLNESPFLSNHGNHNKTSLYATESANASGTELGRPPSVSLPSIGQEGNEYAEVFGSSDELGGSPKQTRNIANDLQLHAPKPSLPTASAKQRVSAVTRTDSGQAAAYGIGKASNAGDDKDPASRSLKSKPSFASQTSNGTERRPSSVSDSEHGIPQIGQIVPMYPNAGDVQAPSPAPFVVTGTPGVGFHNDGTKSRHHGRKLSARGHEIPSDAYGRYGHGVALPHDRFEKAYYEKHPDLFKKELGQYGEGRPEWAMSSEDLNKIVRDTASRGVGFGTPSEQIGFQASEEYASRMSSPRPGVYHVAHSNASETHVDSPLRKQSIPDTAGKAEFESTLSRSLKDQSDVSLGSEIEDDNVIHVEAPSQRTEKIYGGYGHAESTEDLGPHSEGDGIHDERGYSAPILASDEVAKEPFGWELQPAVSPMNDRRGSGYYEDSYHYRSGSQSSSRPGSRPGSIHGTLADFVPPKSTPLEDLDEYEPLFPEEEKNKVVTEKPLTTADRLKRPEMKNRKFPSQDIWEDSPNSLHYTATVSTPQLPEDEEEKKDSVFTETPAQAFARRQEELAEVESKSSESFLHLEKEKKPWAHKNHLTSEMRPDMKQRFPSRDIWEDTPDSLQLQTTVATPQMDEKDITSPPEERPTTGAVVYHQEKAAAGLPLGSEEGRATTGLAAVMKPQIPARPMKSKLSSSPEKPQPTIPERPAQRAKQISPIDGPAPPLPTKPKPQVPARPSKPVTRESSETVPLSQVISNSSTKSTGSEQGSVAAAKPKPPIPTRPIGSKIAALQGGFMSDLNKRLQLGPQAPKKDEPAPEEPEPVKEKAPLVDARKGRARGPARRAPAKSPAPITETPAEKPSTLVFFSPSTLWSIDPDEDLLHVASHEEEIPAKRIPKTEQPEASALSTNTAGESLQESPEATVEPTAEPTAEPENATVPPLIVEDAHAEKVKDAHAEKAEDAHAEKVEHAHTEKVDDAHAEKAEDTHAEKVEDTHAEKVEEAEKSAVVSEAVNDVSEPTAPSDEPKVTESSSTLEVPEPEEEDLSASTATLKPEAENENVE